MNTSDSPAPAVARWFRRSFFLVIGLAVLYVLSAGPALMLAQRRWVSTDIVEAVYFSPYSPLEMVTLIVPGADWLMKRYVGLWAAEDPQP